MDEIEKNNGEIIIYRTEDGRTQLEVRLENENVWLSQQQIANLFGVQRPAITKHLKNIFESGELEENSVSSILEHTASDGKNYKTQFYNLDAIISVGYRVNSLQATHFRRWATERLKEYLIKGFAMDDKRLKEMGGGGYWYELLNRIRDIRSSEKVLYRQVLDLYATSVDYDPKADESIRFFKIVQNKLHYAAHGHTAAEVIFERADAEKPFMGLTTFPGEQPRKEDVLIAKNYLNEKELKILNNLVLRLRRNTSHQTFAHVYVGLYTSPGPHLIDHRRASFAERRHDLSRTSQTKSAGRIPKISCQNPVACRRSIF